MERIVKHKKEIQEMNFNLQKTCFEGKWTQVNDTISAVDLFEPSNGEYVNSLLEFLTSMRALRNGAQFQLIQDQLRLLIIPLNGYQFIKYNLILVAGIFGISLPTWWMLPKSGGWLATYYQDLLTIIIWVHFRKNWSQTRGWSTYFWTK